MSENSSKPRLKKTKSPSVTEKRVKCTQAELNQRVSEVQTLLLEGRTRTYIYHYGVEKWKISERQIDEYIKSATEQIREINLHTAESNLSIITRNLWGLYRKAVEPTNLNISEANKILMNIAKLRGLDQVTINLNVENRDLASLSDEELEAILLEENETSIQ